MTPAKPPGHQLIRLIRVRAWPSSPVVKHPVDLPFPQRFAGEPPVDPDATIEVCTHILRPYRLGPTDLFQQVYLSPPCEHGVVCVYGGGDVPDATLIEAAQTPLEVPNDHT